MKHQVDESLKNLLVEVSTLVPLENNPRRGNVEAILASYREFGQLKPIVIRPNDDGTATVIAGNHQLKAAQLLGWTHIAAVPFEADDSTAIAFALADNRTNELGYTDTSMLNTLLNEINDDYSHFLDEMGWDIFEMASIAEHANRIDSSSDSDGSYVPPVLINLTQQENTGIAVEQTEAGSRLVPSVAVDAKEVATTGSTSIGASGTTNAIVQYSLVFDSVEQQKRWYSFIRWLRTDVGTDGETTAERLMNFLESHVDF